MNGNFQFLLMITSIGVLIRDLAIPDAPRISPLPRRSVDAERPIFKTRGRFKVMFNENFEMLDNYTNQ